MNSIAALVAGHLQERRVVKIWQDFVPGRADLFTEDDRPLEVVYPGRPNDDKGADLRDAVIATGRRLRKGDVEVHVRSSSWWGHGHHQDPLYNRVILHVVYWHDIAAAVTLQNGHKVPTLALEKFFTGTDAVHPSSRRPLPCRARAGRRGHAFISHVLDAAGDRRFVHKVAEFGEELSRLGAEQALYRGILGALGYVKNKMPMIELARRLPLSKLRAAAPAEIPREESLATYQALLMGTAGLLLSPVGRYDERSLADGWVDRLEDIWADLGQEATMSFSDWHTFKVRPGNLPRRRLAAMSYLLRRYRDEGLVTGLMREVEKAPLYRGCINLGEGLLVSAEGFWAENLDFGVPAPRIVPALLGADRADIIVINVLLPFAAAWGQAASLLGLAEKAREIYWRYPALAENTVEKHMRRQLGISRCPVNSARRQQGLLHIYKTLCSQGKCPECPLGG